MGQGWGTSQLVAAPDAKWKTVVAVILLIYFKVMNFMLGNKYLTLWLTKGYPKFIGCKLQGQSGLLRMMQDDTSFGLVFCD